MKRIFKTSIILFFVAVLLIVLVIETLEVLKPRMPIEILSFPSKLTLLPGEFQEFNITVKNYDSRTYKAFLCLRLENKESNYLIFEDKTYNIVPGRQDLKLGLRVKLNASPLNATLVISIIGIEHDVFSSTATSIEIKQINYPYKERGPYFVRARYVGIPLQIPNSAGQNVIQSKIYYPAVNCVKTDLWNAIYFPPNNTNAPYPVLIFLPAANVNLEQYTWLFEHICSYGYIVVSVNELLGGIASRHNLENLIVSFNLYSPHSTITAILDFLKSVNSNGKCPNNFLLNGMIDLSKIALGGHSYGGSQVLLTGNRSLYQNWGEIKAVFTYGVHTFGSGTGTSPPTLYQTIVNVPLLMVGGTEDHVGDGPDENGVERTGAERIKITYEKAVRGGKNDTYLLLVKNANHMAFANKPDPTVDRSFLETQVFEELSIINRDEAQTVFKNYITAFLKAYVEEDINAKNYLEQAPLNDPFVTDFCIK